MISRNGLPRAFEFQDVDLRFQAGGRRKLNLPLRRPRSECVLRDRGLCSSPSTLKLFTELCADREDENLLRNQSILLAMLVHPPSSRGRSQMDPVGCPVTGSPESSRVNEGFQEHGIIAVHLKPVAWKHSGQE